MADRNANTRDTLRDDLKRQGREIAEAVLAKHGIELRKDHKFRLREADKNPSVFLNAQGVWCDHGDNDRGGDAFDLVARLEGLDIKRQFPEVLQRSAALIGYSTNGATIPQNQKKAVREEKSSPPPTPKAEPAATAEADPPVIEHFTLAETAERYGLTVEDFAEEGVEVVDAYFAVLGKRSPAMAYPVTKMSAEGALDSTVHKFKSLARVNGKRVSSAKTGSGFVDGFFPAIPDRCINGLLAITEGEEKAIALRVSGVSAVTGMNGAQSLNEAQMLYARTMKAKGSFDRVVIVNDQDKAGKVAAAALAAQLHGEGIAVSVVCWPKGTPDKWDVNDTFKEGYKEAVVELVNGAKPWPFTDDVDAGDGPAPKDEGGQEEKAPKATPLPKTIKSYADIANTDFGPMEYIVDGLLPQSGQGLLAAPPKGKKSFFSLQLAIAVSLGGFILGSPDFACPRGHVLYLALEDSERRIQSRVRQLMRLMGTEEIPTFEFSTFWPLLDQGGLDAMVNWARSKPTAPRLIVVDTLAKIRGAGRGRGNAYEEDYRQMGALQRAALDAGFFVLVITHLRKGLDGGDQFDRVTGSAGITASGDVNMVIQGVRGQEAAILHVTGRDIEEAQIAIRFDEGLWTYAGSAEELTATEDERAVRVLARESKDGVVRIKDFADATGRTYPTAKKTLQRMAFRQQIEALGKGTYAPILATETDNSGTHSWGLSPTCPRPLVPKNEGRSHE